MDSKITLNVIDNVSLPPLENVQINITGNEDIRGLVDVSNPWRHRADKVRLSRSRRLAGSISRRLQGRCCAR